MPLAPNTLLQAASQAKTQAAPANPLANAAAPGDKASSFAQVYAKEAQSKPAAVADNAPKPVNDKGADTSGKKDVASSKAAAPGPAVADSGKSLPAAQASTASTTSTVSTTDKTDSKASDDQRAATDAPVADSTPAPVDPALDPALMQAAQPVPAPVPAPPTPTVPAAQPQAEALPAAVAAAPVASPAPAPVAATDPAFDPAADPLDALPVVRLALEQSGHISASSQAQPKADPATVQGDGELTSAQQFANGMATMLDLQTKKDSTASGDDKTFSGLIDDGLKDLKGASSDTRVDDFANRLAALTQAATPKTANALPVNQPLAMHQSGWTEEVVNRVMYLSSANLKSADIQLQPAELGRLDIRVNMIPDQQTQVTFMSAHAGVREALEGQMYRLRDMFQQQGMGQVDVNVSDQSRGWQGQEQAQQGQNRSHGSNGNGTRLDSADDELPLSVAEVAASTAAVVGSSAVDYYA